MARRTLEVPSEVELAVNMVERLLKRRRLGTGLGTGADQDKCSALLERLRDYGFDRFLSGRTRAVFVRHQEDVVLKVPILKKDEAVNKFEFAFPNRSPEEYLCHFPHVRMFGSAILAQEHAGPNLDRYSGNRDWIEEVAARIKISDIHSDNIGWKKRVFVFIDPLDGDQENLLRRGLHPLQTGRDF